MQITRLGPYEIGKPLGKGGMGSVFEATNVDTGERVAVKALTPQLAMAEGFRERFEAEIESLKALSHDGIVRLYGYGEQDGVLFYSMELVEGVSLEDELKAGRRFNWREVTEIAIQLSLALKHAHDHGIVHRDIKPANVLLFGNDRVKLADFGIARLFGTTQLTTAGGVLGTADYMSPEQADGRPVTARCDQYSLGGVMYALLTGRPPFRAKNLPQMLQLQRFAQAEPVRRYAPDTPQQLERLIAQLLAKEPTDRFPNMLVLARHLQAMVNALSRPMADDFALTTDEAATDRTTGDWDDAIAREVTQAEADVASEPRDKQLAEEFAPRPTIPLLPSDVLVPDGPQSATTLAADEPPRAVRTPAKVRTEPPTSTSVANGAAAKPPERTAHFTTLEEDEARRLAKSQRSWILAAAQLVALGAVLAMVGVLAWYISRPPTADELYQTIASQAKNESAESLTSVESEIREFLNRFADDPRTAAVRTYQSQIELDKFDRRLQRQPRSGGADSALLPIERLYLDALQTATTSPETAAAMLQSLLDLYPPDVAPAGHADVNTSAEVGNASDVDARTKSVNKLADRELAQLKASIAAQNKQRQAEIRERLTVAGRLSANEPQQAAAIYQAIVDLYGQFDGATELVTEARQRLDELKKKD